MTTTTLADRLKLALDGAGLNQSELSRRVGVTRGTVSLWFSGTTTSLLGQNLVRTADILGVSANWLSTGRGRMKKGERQEIPLEGNPDYPAIKRVKVKTSAGMTGFEIESLDDDDAPIIFSRSWYEKRGLEPENLIAVRVPGPSMEPGLYDGDWAVIDTADSDPKDATVFALNLDGELAIRRLFRTDGVWMAACDNADKRIYRDRTINGETQIIGRVVHKQSERI